MSKFRRRLMGLAALRQDFVRVEYIENTSTAYIDTNIQFNLSMEISGKFQNMDNTTSERDRRYFGGVTTWKGYGISVSENSIMLNEALSSDDGIKTYNVSTPFEIHYKNKSVTVNNYTVNLNTTKGNSTKVPTIYLLAEHRPNTAALSFLIGRLYYFKIYNASGTLVRDYIPMYQKSKDLYGLWDRVEGKFYTSPNGVKFIGGHQIIYDAEIEYLESNGTQSIDTLYVPKGYDNTIETKITYLGYSNTNSWRPWFSAYVDEETNTYRIIRYGNSNTKIFVYNGNKANGGGINKDVTIGSDYDFKIYPSYFVVNGTRYNFTTLRGKENTNTLRLFSSSGTKIRMWGFKLTKGSTVVLDMIPVRVGNVGYMYDKISNKLFGNNGSGNFILGQDTVVYDKI